MTTATPTAPEQFDLFLFGSTSELVRKLVGDHHDWFKRRVRRLVVSQRGTAVPPEYAGFDFVPEPLDCADPRAFRAGLAEVVARHASRDRLMHVFPTYGKFTWDYAKRSPCFAYADDGFQVTSAPGSRSSKRSGPSPGPPSSTSSARSSPASRTAASTRRACGSSTSLPRHPAYRDLDVNVYNIGGCKTRFWNHRSMPNNPFLHDAPPTDRILRGRIRRQAKGRVLVLPVDGRAAGLLAGAEGARLL